MRSRSRASGSPTTTRPRRSARRRAAPTSPAAIRSGWPSASRSRSSRRRPTDVGLPPDHPTVASLLKGNGYETALVGKWHLGWKPEFGPNRHGFDEFFGILSGAADYFTHRASDGRNGSRAAGGAPDLWENLAPIERVGYLTDLLSDKAVEIIGRPRTQAVLPEPAVQRAALAVGRARRRRHRPRRNMGPARWSKAARRRSTRR